MDIYLGDPNGAEVPLPPSKPAGKPKLPTLSDPFHSTPYRLRNHSFGLQCGPYRLEPRYESCILGHDMQMRDIRLGRFDGPCA